MWERWRTYGPFFPYIVSVNDDDSRVKEGDEYYHVFVNDHYVGNKESLSQGDGGASAVGDYLKSRGFEGVDIKAEGDHIKVYTDDRSEDDIRRHLSVYLSIR